MFYGWIVVGAYGLLMGTTWGATQGAFGVFVKPIAADTDWSRTAISGAFSLLVIINFCVGTFWGWLSERWSVRGVVAGTGALVGIGFILTSTSQTLWQMYLYYGIVSGVGLGGMAGPLAGITSRWFYQRRGLAIAIGFAGMGLGTGLMPILTERIISQNNWQVGFFALGLIIWGGVLLGFSVLKEPGRVSMLWKAYGIGIDGAPSSSTTSSSSIDPAPGRKAHGRRDSLSLSVSVKTRNFWLIFGQMFLGVLVLYVILIHLVPRMTDAGIPSSVAVAIFTGLNIVSVGSTLTAGIFADRFGPRRVIIVSMFVEALALIWLAAATKLWMFLVFAVTYGVGYGAWNPQLATLTAYTFGSRNVGAIYSVILLGAGLGGIIGPLLAASIFDYTNSYQLAFVLSSIIAFVGLILAYFVDDTEQGLAAMDPATPKSHTKIG